MSSKTAGTVKWFDSAKGIGFITSDAGPEIFVHHTGIQGDGFTLLKKGQSVEYLPTQTELGLQASDVVVICDSAVTLAG